MICGIPPLSSFLIHTNAPRLLRILLQMLLPEESGFHTHFFKGRLFYLSLSSSVFCRGLFLTLFGCVLVLWQRRIVMACYWHGCDLADYF